MICVLLLRPSGNQCLPIVQLQRTGVDLLKSKLKLSENISKININSRYYLVKFAKGYDLSTLIQSICKQDEQDQYGSMSLSQISQVEMVPLPLRHKNRRKESRFKTGCCYTIMIGNRYELSKTIKKLGTRKNINHHCARNYSNNKNHTHSVSVLYSTNSIYPKHHDQAD